MTTIAELAPTPSMRDSDARVGRRGRFARLRGTPVFITLDPQGRLHWLQPWLEGVDYLQFAAALTEDFRPAHAPSSRGLLELDEAAFSTTPASHASDLVDFVRRSFSPAQPAPPTSRPSPSGPPTAEPNPAVAAVRDLRRWLNLTVEQVADLVGTSKSAIHYWRRQNAPPRPGAARNLLRVHALVRALRAAVAPDSPLVALTRRPDDGGPSAYDLLLAGRYDDAEQLLRPLIFRRSDQPIQRPRLITSPEESAAPAETGLTVRPPVRRARRVSLPK